MSAQAVTIEAADVIDAAEAFTFIKSPLTQAGERVTEDFEGFATPYTLAQLRPELLALAASPGPSKRERA